MAEALQTNSVLAIITGALTKELQPLDIWVNRSFKVKLLLRGSTGWQKTRRLQRRRAGYLTICQWIMDAWANVTVSCIDKAFKKAWIVRDGKNCDETNLDDEEENPGASDGNKTLLRCKLRSVLLWHWRWGLWGICGWGMTWSEFTPSFVYLYTYHHLPHISSSLRS